MGSGSAQPNVVHRSPPVVPSYPSCARPLYAASHEIPSTFRPTCSMLLTTSTPICSTLRLPELSARWRPGPCAVLASRARRWSKLATGHGHTHTEPSSLLRLRQRALGQHLAQLAQFLEDSLLVFWSSCSCCDWDSSRRPDPRAFLRAAAGAGAGGRAVASSLPALPLGIAALLLLPDEDLRSL